MMMISEHFSLLNFVFLHLALLMLRQIINARVKVVHVNRASLDPEFILFGFSTQEISSISVEAELPQSS